MIVHAIIETAYKYSLDYKRACDSGWAETQKGNELYGAMRAFADFITAQGLDSEYKKYIEERRSGKKCVREGYFRTITP